MNTFLILIPSFLLYVVFVYWLLRRFGTKGISKESVASERVMKPMNLTYVVKQVLDLLLVLSLFALFVMPIVFVVMIFSQSQIPTWGVDIGVFSGFMLDFNQIAGAEATGIRLPQFSGKTIINIDTSNLYAWHLYVIATELTAFTSIYVQIQLRAIVISFQNGNSFTQYNSQRIKKIGIVVIAWNALHPFLQYFAWGSVVKGISFNTKGFQLYPAFEVNVMGLLIGFILILLSKMLQEAADMKQDQELTI